MISESNVIGEIQSSLLKQEIDEVLAYLRSLPQPIRVELFVPSPSMYQLSCIDSAIGMIVFECRGGTQYGVDIIVDGRLSGFDNVFTEFPDALGKFRSIWSEGG